MSILIIVLIAWILYPFFGIPFAIAVKSQNEKLKKKIEDLEFEIRKLRYGKSKISAVQPLQNKSVEPGFVSELITETEADEEFSEYSNDSIAEPLPDETHEAAEMKDDYIFNAAEESFVPDNTRNSGKTRNVSGLLITGVSMILLAGLIFVTTNWSVISNGVKIFMMLLATAMFFGASVFSEKKLCIHSTSKGFYVLGALFIPVTCISFFFFEIPGEWLSFSGDGRWLALMAVFLSCSFSCILIARKYQIQFFAFTSMMFISAAVGSLGLFTDIFAGLLIVCAGYTVLLLVINEDTLTRSGVPFIFSGVYKLYSRISAFAFAFVMLIYTAADESAAEAAVVMLFVIALTLFIQLKTETTFSEILCRIASVLEYFIMLSLVISEASGAGMISGVSQYHLAYSLLCIPAFAAYAFIPRIKSVISETLLTSVLFVISMFCFTEGSPAACAVVLAMIIYNAVKGNGYTNVLSSAVSVPLVWQLLYLCNSDSSAAALLVSTVISVVFAVSVFASRRFEQLRITSVVMGIYAAVIPFFVSLIYLSPAVSFIEAASFALAAFEHARAERKVHNILSMAAAVTDIQFFIVIICNRFLFTDYVWDYDFMPAYIIGFAVTALLTAAGFALRKLNSADGKTAVYLSCIINLVMLVCYPPSYDGYWPFVFETVFVLYCIAAGLVSDGIVRKLFFTAGTVLGSAAFIFQNFVVIPELIKPEYILAGTMLPYIFLFRIWREERKAVDISMFVHSITAIIIISGAAIAENELFHALFIGIVCVAVIIITAFTKDRKWRIMANTTLILLTLYMTRDFWASLAWWVYLLTAGIILIAYAAFNEYCRQTGTENMIKNEIDNMIQSVKNKTDK